MTRKQLIVLLIIAGVLAVITVVRQWPKPSEDLSGQMGLVVLPPDGFAASEVSKIEIYTGAKKDEKVVLEKKKEGWVVVSRFDAPGSRDKIQGFLDKMKGLKGELRSDSADVLGDYRLRDNEALHIILFRKQGAKEQPWYDLLAGKTESYNNCFVRKADGNAVYTVNVNLPMEVGLSTEAADKAPPSSDWVEKKILAVGKDKITRIALKTPNHSLVFEKREKPVAENKEKQEKDAEKKQKDEKAAKKEYEWVVAEGPADLKFKQAGLDDLMKSLESFEGTDVENPVKKKELGLDSPGFRCEVDTGTDPRTVILASRPKPGPDGYAFVEGKPGIVYKIADWKFGELFKEGKDLFELPGLSMEKAKINEIDLVTPAYQVTLEGTGKGEERKWLPKSPAIGLKPQDAPGKDLAGALAEWKPADYADGKDLAAFGLAKPERAATILLDDGKKHTLAVGAETKDSKGRYVLLDGGKRVWVASSADLDKAFPEFKSFFELTAADVSEEKIQRVNVEGKNGAFVLKRDGKKWLLAVGDKPVEPDKDKMEAYLRRFAPLMATDVSVSDEAQALMKNITAKVELVVKDSPGVTFELGGEKDGNVAARVSGKSAVLFFPGSTAGDLAPPSKSLCKEEPISPKKQQESKKTSPPETGKK